MGICVQGWMCILLSHVSDEISRKCSMCQLSFFYVCLNVENNLQPVMNFRPLWRYYFSPGDHVNDDDDDGILISWRALQTATATKSNTNFCEFLMACAITEVYDPYGDVFMWQNYYYYFYCRFCILSNWEKRRNYILNSIKTNRCRLVSSKMWRKRRRKRQHFKCSFNLYNSTRLSLCHLIVDSYVRIHRCRLSNSEESPEFLFNAHQMHNRKK